MRNINIISSMANGISNFVNAANDALRLEMQLQLPGYQCLKPAIVGASVQPSTRLHAGIIGTALQSRIPQSANWVSGGIEQTFDVERLTAVGRSREFETITGTR